MSRTHSHHSQGGTCSLSVSSFDPRHSAATTTTCTSHSRWAARSTSAVERCCFLSVFSADLCQLGVGWVGVRVERERGTGGVCAGWVAGGGSAMLFSLPNLLSRCDVIRGRVSGDKSFRCVCIPAHLMFAPLPWSRTCLAWSTLLPTLSTCRVSTLTRDGLIAVLTTVRLVLTTVPVYPGHLHGPTGPTGPTAPTVWCSC